MKKSIQQVCLNATSQLCSSSRSCALHHTPVASALGGLLSTRRYSQPAFHADGPGSERPQGGPLFTILPVPPRDNRHPGSATRQSTNKPMKKHLGDESRRDGNAGKKSRKHGDRQKGSQKVKAKSQQPTQRKNNPRNAVEMSHLSDQELDANKNAQMDIFNYCARLGYLPTTSIQKAVSAGRHGRKYTIFTIVLEEQGITASANARNARAAETAACLNFKKQVEKLHAEGSAEHLSIEDSTTISTTNAKEFVAFYKILNKDAKVEFRLNPSMGRLGVLEAHVELDGDALGGDWCVRTTASRKTVEDLAYLKAAMILAASDPSIMPQFQIALAEGQGSILPPARVLHWDISDRTIRKVDNVLRDVQRMGLPRPSTETFVEKDARAPAPMRDSIALLEDHRPAKNADLKHRLETYRTSPSLAEKRALRDSLPMSQARDSVLQHINNNMYSVIVGATGSGKTTQVPQILLEDAIDNDIGAACNIVCTQPRRIAATSVASRVAAERGERLQRSVGYHVRFDPRTPEAGGSITYCTTGILLQRLQKHPDQVLDSLTHIIIDEVHERDIIIDFLMVTLKKIIPVRRAAGKPVPKVVLMSATIDSKLFATYFQETTADGVTHSCPSLSIPGRTFPVKEKYFEDIVVELQKTASEGFRQIVRSDRDTADYMRWESAFNSASGVKSENEDVEAVIDWNKLTTVDGQAGDEKQDATVPISLVVATIAHIAKTTSDGAVLVFLPGYDEIKKVKLALTQTKPMGIDFLDESQYRLSTLHSSVPAAEQAEVFQSVPAGCRKIILSTNIAETSVTIPDIQHVVDTGKLREKRFDQIRGITKLQCTWISKSNAKQRAGRAGRVQNGNYYALYSRARYESFRAIGLPEMLRSDLQEVCLDIKAQSFKSPVRDFLAASIEAPAPEAVNAAVVRLVEMQALTEDEEITPLGRLLASLPTHPALGKMIVLGVIFRCLDPMVILGASMNERSIFVAPPDKKREARQAQSQFIDPNAPTDHLAFITAFMQMRQILTTQNDWDMVGFGNRNFIHTGAFKTINSTTKQIEQVLEEAGLLERHVGREPRAQIGSANLNTNSRNLNLIKALIVAGLHPNLALPYGMTYRTKREMRALIHPSSFNFSGYRKKNKTDDLMSFSSLIKSGDGGSTFLKDTTPVSILSAILFGGRLSQKGREVTLNNWLKILGHSGLYGGVDKVVTFRNVMDLLLGTAFADLAHLKQNKSGTEHDGNQRGETRDRLNSYHKYDKVREVFAKGLVELLDIDAGDTAGPGAASGQSVRRFVPDNRSSSGSRYGDSGSRYGDSGSRYGDSGINSVSRSLGLSFQRTRAADGSLQFGSSSGLNTGSLQSWASHGEKTDSARRDGEHGSEQKRSRFFGDGPSVTERMGWAATSRARREYQ
ncbi:P-loop containing nucleoside triphosphate hydrolase protein [Venturia nashicola]|uniref:P-loop containing nucleoside triphosphate hydrolase protein n=1 Tax=Venturia nashicola TaxID=86259 RepID=A0A4Z1PDY3_9PEZI|nr:P-loop containing nucleoside triphosphate hydrolase protein [Venturia nashicola]